MSDADRRRRFKAYFRERLESDRALLGQRTGYTKGRISQFFDGNQPFGERAASQLALRLRLPADYFDRDERRPADPSIAAPVLAEDQLELLRLWADLIPDQRTAIMAELQKQHAFIVQAMNELKLRHLTSSVPENALPADFTRPAQRELPAISGDPAGKRRRK